MTSADLPTRRLGYLYVLKVCKLLLTVAGQSLVHMVVDACQLLRNLEGTPRTVQLLEVCRCAAANHDVMGNHG